MNVDLFPDMPTFARKSQIRMGLLVTTYHDYDHYYDGHNFPDVEGGSMSSVSRCSIDHHTPDCNMHR